MNKHLISSLSSVSAKALLVIGLFMNAAEATEIIPERDGFFVRSTVKYPQKVFSAEEFLEKIDENLDQIANKPVLELDLSNDDSLTSKDIRKILTNLSKRDIKIRFLNLSNTAVEEDVMLVFEGHDDLKVLNISNTPAAQSSVIGKNKNIIFIPEKILGSLRGKLNEAFDKEIIQRHLSYYDTTQTYSNAWEQYNFEGINLRRVMSLVPDKDNEFNSDMQNALLTSTTLINLRTLDLTNQNINDDFIRRLCESDTSARIINLNLSGNLGITDKSLEYISSSDKIGNVRDMPQISGRYEVPSSEIYITTKGTNISLEAIQKYQEKPQKTEFTIRYLHPFTNQPTFEPVSNGIKWLQFKK